MPSRRILRRGDWAQAAVAVPTRSAPTTWPDLADLDLTARRPKQRFGCDYGLRTCDGVGQSASARVSAAQCRERLAEAQCVPELAAVRVANRAVEVTDEPRGQPVAGATGVKHSTR